MTGPDQPMTAVARPALEAVANVGFGRPSVEYDEFASAAGKPPSTVHRYLQQLREQELLVRVRKGEYAVPGPATFGRLLVEPDAYRRSVLLYADVLPRRGEEDWALACLPVRDRFEVRIPQAIPVLKPDDRLEATGRSPPYDEVLWYDVDEENRTSVQAPWNRDPDDAVSIPETLPALVEERCLALLASSLDPRYVQAARKAALDIGLDLEPLARAARGLHPETPPLRTIRPNTVVFPAWLADFWDTARDQYSADALTSRILSRAGEDSSRGPDGA